MSLERLDKIIATQGLATRKEAGRLIRKGMLAVDGICVKDPSKKAETDTAEIVFCGKKVNFKKHIFIMMNKPMGVVSSTDDGDITVIDLVPPELFRKGLFPAGRLDKDTTGMVLITDDGGAAHRMLAPSSHVPKEYIASLAEPLRIGAEAEFAQGVTLADGYECLPAEVICTNDERTAARVILREGKYHQIKRMFAACGNRVTALHRTRMGGLCLDPALSPGDCREITPEELESIFIR